MSILKEDPIRGQMIGLTGAEQKLYETFCEYKESHESMMEEAVSQAASELMSSLLKRGGIPKRRLAFFTDPRFNPEGHKMSYLGVFERNGCKGVDMYGHPHFYEFLEFLINGADLPDRVKQELDEIFKRSFFHDDAAEKVFAHVKTIKRRLMGQLGRKELSEQVYRLLLDYDCGVAQANLIRRKIMAWR